MWLSPTSRASSCTGARSCESATCVTAFHASVISLLCVRSEFRAGEICMYAALGYVATQVAKVRLSALDASRCPARCLHGCSGCSDALGYRRACRCYSGVEGTVGAQARRSIPSMHASIVRGIVEHRAQQCTYGLMSSLIYFTCRCLLRLPSCHQRI